MAELPRQLSNMYSVNNMDIKKFKGAIFDLDGTLFDSMGIWKDVDLAFFERRNIEMPDDYQEAIKDMHFKPMAEYTKERFDLPDDIYDIMDEWCELCFEEYEKNVPLKDGAKEYIDKLIEKEYVKNPDDIYKLTYEMLLTIDLIKDKSANNLLNAINESKNVFLAKFINALGIKLVGKESSNILAQNYKTIEKTMQKALILAQKTAEDTQEAASKKAHAIEKEAMTKAELLVGDAKREFELVHQRTIQLLQQYEKYKLQFKNLAAAQIELLETESFQISIMETPKIEVEANVEVPKQVEETLEQEELPKIDINFTNVASELN